MANAMFTATPSIQWTNSFTAANTAKDGTGTVNTVFTAGIKGSYISELRFRSLGTNVTTVARIFINNGGSNAVASNNVLIGEVTLNATTLSEVGALSNYTYPMNFAIPAGYVVNVVIGTAVAAGFVVSAFGGHY